MKFLTLSILFLLLTHCGHKRLETQCGCDPEEKRRRQYLVTGNVSSSNGASEGVAIYQELLNLVEIDRRDIYGICLENDNNRERIIFCTDNTREYEDVEDRFSDIVTLRSEEFK